MAQYKMIAICNRKEGMTLEEFRKYVLDVHVPLVAKMPGLKKYTQNFVTHGEEASPYDCVTELWFDSKEAREQAYASPEGEAALADAPLCVNMEKIIMMDTEEVDIPLNEHA